MNAILIRPLVQVVPTGILFSCSTLLFVTRKTVPSLLQMLGAACVMLVVLTHVGEALQWLPWMGWGEEHSVDHYLDLTSAVLGVVLLALGLLPQAHFVRNHPHRRDRRK
jgi:hypothetical protein